MNSRGNVEERLARWLLMAHDRIDGDELALTHEFLSIMLGVRRASVTDMLRILAEEDLVALKRGTITILDRKTLQTRSNGFYLGGNPHRHLSGAPFVSVGRSGHDRLLVRCRGGANGISFRCRRHKGNYSFVICVAAFGQLKGSPLSSDQSAWNGTRDSDRCHHDPCAARSREAMR